MLKPGSSRNGTWKKKILFFSWLGLVWLEMKPEWQFWIFYFKKKKIGNSPTRVKKKQYPEWNFFYSFSACPSLVWLEMKPKYCFFNFFFFLLLFWIFLECFDPSQVERYPEQYFYFSLFSTYPGPVWLEIKLEWSLLIFWNFWECSNPGWVETVPRTKIFFFFLSVSPALVWLKMKPEWHF